MDGRALTGGPGMAEEPDPVKELSSQEKADIQKDPAVEEVVTLFGGKVVEYPRVAPDLPEADPGDRTEPDSADED